MPDTLWQPLGGFFVGMAGGALYFGGLWLTVTHLLRSERPMRLLAVSFVVRMAMLLVVFYLLLPSGWLVAAMALAGLLAARQLWLRSKCGRKVKQWTSVPMQPSSGSGE